MRIVLDTNVALSALLWRSTPYRLLETIRQRGDVQIISSAALLEELQNSGVRPRVLCTVAAAEKWGRVRSGRLQGRAKVEA